MARGCDLIREELRWLTVLGASEAEGAGLLRNPHPAAKAFTRALVEHGMLHASFAADDVATARGQLEV